MHSAYKIAMSNTYLPRFSILGIWIFLMISSDYDWPVLPTLSGRQRLSHFCQMREGMIHALKSWFAVHVRQILNDFCTHPIRSYSGVYIYWPFHKIWGKTARKHSQFWVKEVYRCDGCHVECSLDTLICMHEISDAVSAFFNRKYYALMENISNNE
jgi:hypothetical protein